MSYLIALFTHRPYVMAMFLGFVFLAIAERGWLRMFIWSVVATFVAWFSEFVSIRTGFPFSWYEYYPTNFPDELWIGGIPLFASLGFCGMAYFAQSLAYTLLSPLRKGPNNIERAENMLLLNSVKVALLASIIATWADLVIDPIAHLGEYWFLGKIYFWITTAGAWYYDIPLWNYFGWLVTIFAMVYPNQLIDKYLLSRGIAHKPALQLPNRCLWSFAFYLGNYLFMLAVIIYLNMNPALPPEKHTGLILTSTIALSSAFLIFNIVTIRRKLKQPA